MSTVDFTNLAPVKSDADYIPNKKEDNEELPEMRGKIEFKKKPFAQRVFSDFKKGWPHLLFDVILPEAGSLAFDSAMNLLRDCIFGSSPAASSYRRRGKGYYNDVVEYSDYYDARNGRPSNNGRNERMQKRSYDEFIFTDRLDVEDIILALKKEAHRDHKVSVSTLYSIIRRELKNNKYSTEIISMLESPEYTDESWGWYIEDLQDARVEVLGRDRFCLDLPKAVAIK